MFHIAWTIDRQRLYLLQSYRWHRQFILADIYTLWALLHWLRCGPKQTARYFTKEKLGVPSMTKSIILHTRYKMKKLFTVSSLLKADELATIEKSWNITTVICFTSPLRKIYINFVQMTWTVSSMHSTNVSVKVRFTKYSSDPSQLWLCEITADKNV